MTDECKIFRHQGWNSIFPVPGVDDVGDRMHARNEFSQIGMAKLQGSWQLVYQKMNARKLPDENAAEMFNGKMVFAGEKIRYTVELPGFDFGFAYQLHPAHQPKEIDLELIQSRDRQDIGQKLLGIYLLEGDSLKICHSKTKRPADFDAGERSQNVLIVLKRKLSERGGEK